MKVFWDIDEHICRGCEALTYVVYKGISAFPLLPFDGMSLRCLWDVSMFISMTRGTPSSHILRSNIKALISSMKWKILIRLHLLIRIVWIKYLKWFTFPLQKNVQKIWLGKCSRLQGSNKVFNWMLWRQVEGEYQINLKLLRLLTFSLQTHVTRMWRLLNVQKGSLCLMNPKNMDFSW